MEYTYFIGILKQHQTRHVKALAFPQSCAPVQIPGLFGLLLPDIVELLENRIDQFCTGDQVLALFGLQPGSIALASDYPQQHDRIINAQHPRVHLCCSLAYLTSAEQQLMQIETWHGSQNIIIDFTTGAVMDGRQYLALVLNQPLPGIIYGTLDEEKLTATWAMFRQYQSAGLDAITPITALAA
jgi:hypothetical protein